MKSRKEKNTIPLTEKQCACCSHIAEVIGWEVTFSTKDDPTAPNTVVYMNGDGVTELVAE